MKKVAIVLPVYNHLEYTKKCIQLLHRLTKQQQYSNSQYRIVIVDDGSTDGTGKWLHDNFSDLDVLRGDGSLWWSGGVNVGAKIAISEFDADFILLWNNDIIPASDYFIRVDELIGLLDENTVVGSKIFYQGDDRKIWSYGGVFNPRNGKKYMIGMDLPDSQEFNKVLTVDWLPGMGTLIPVEVIQNIGYWDETTFPQYHGDSDFTYRAKKAGFKIEVHPELLLWNDKSSSGLTHGDTFRGLVKSFSSIRSNMHIRKNIAFYKRHADSPWAYRFLLRFYFKVIGGFVKWKVLSLMGKKRNL